MANRIYNFCGFTYWDVKSVEAVLKVHGVCGWFIEHNAPEDLIREDGENKQPHIHFVIKCSSAHTVSAVQGWFKHSINGLQQKVEVQACNSLRGAIRYLCHLDDVDKYMYSPDNVGIVGGRLAERIFQDAMSENGEEDRQANVIFAYVNREITLAEAIALAPEIFIHKYASIRNLVVDLRREQEEQKDVVQDEMCEEV